MSEPITCTPRTVPADAAVAAAEEAIRRNPQNRPAFGQRHRQVCLVHQTCRLLTATRLHIHIPGV